MIFFVYITLFSKNQQYYIGYSENPERRLSEKHSQGKVKATRAGTPYILLAVFPFASELEARGEELRIKRMKTELTLKNW